MVIGGIKDWAVTKIVTAAVTKLATMFNPAGAIIQAVIAIYNTIAFFIERIKQIVDLVEAIVESIANIAEGKITQAANCVERAMARTIPVILGFLARLIGLGDVSGADQEGDHRHPGEGRQGHRRGHRLGRREGEVPVRQG